MGDSEREKTPGDLEEASKILFLDLAAGYLDAFNSLKFMELYTYMCAFLYEYCTSIRS